MELNSENQGQALQTPVSMPHPSHDNISGQQLSLKGENHTVVVNKTPTISEPIFLHKKQNERSVYKCNYSKQTGSQANIKDHEKKCKSREIVLDYLLYCGHCKVAFEYYRCYMEHCEGNPDCKAANGEQFATTFLQQREALITMQRKQATMKAKHQSMLKNAKNKSVKLELNLNVYNSLTPRFYVFY